MDPDSITIFKIPLILGLICESLDKTNFCNCRGTCRLWDQLFNPYVWRRIDADPGSKRSTEAQDYFEGSSTCNQLRDIDIYTRHMNLDKDIDSGTGCYVATDLIRHNPCLRRINITIAEYAQAHIRQSVLTALMALKNLRRLELRFGSTFNAAWVEAIIRHCLDTLVDLAMEFLYPGLLRKPATGLPPGIAFPAWRILLNLRRLGYPNLVELEFCYGADYGLEVFQTLITTLASTLEVL
ncbi:hypothetical protein BGX29_008427 [Mortierella sp. GBA35]|nr:hypothetical protein BGX29_008427 [Mortierella sp. GBA35]